MWKNQKKKKKKEIEKLTKGFQFKHGTSFAKQVSRPDSSNVWVFDLFSSMSTTWANTVMWLKQPISQDPGAATLWIFIFSPLGLCTAHSAFHLNDRSSPRTVAHHVCHWFTPSFQSRPWQTWQFCFSPLSLLSSIEKKKLYSLFKTYPFFILLLFFFYCEGTEAAVEFGLLDPLNGILGQDVDLNPIAE